MPGYTSYSIDYEKIAEEQSSAMEKAKRYFSALIFSNPDNFFESENDSNGMPKNTIQDIRVKNNLKACLLHLYDKNRRQLSVAGTNQINVTLFKLLNDLKNNTDATSAQEIYTLFEKCPEARYYLILFKDALSYSLLNKIFIAELIRREEKTGWLEKKQSIGRLITALENNAEIRLKDKNTLMSEGKTSLVIAFFEEAMPGNCDDVFSVTSEDAGNTEIDNAEFLYRPSSFDFSDVMNPASERTTEQNNSDSSDEEIDCNRGSLRLLSADDFQQNEWHNLVHESLVDINRLSALAYCYKKMRPRTSLFPLSSMMKKAEKIEKIAISDCINMLSYNEKRVIIMPFLERCLVLNVAPYHILAVFNDRDKLGPYAKIIETAAATSDATFNSEMRKYKRNPEAYKAQYKEQAAADNRQISKSL